MRRATNLVADDIYTYLSTTLRRRRRRRRTRVRQTQSRRDAWRAPRRSRARSRTPLGSPLALPSEMDGREGERRALPRPRRRTRIRDRMRLPVETRRRRSFARGLGDSPLPFFVDPDRGVPSTRAGAAPGPAPSRPRRGWLPVGAEDPIRAADASSLMKRFRTEPGKRCAREREPPRPGRRRPPAGLLGNESIFLEDTRGRVRPGEPRRGTTRRFVTFEASIGATTSRSTPRWDGRAVRPRKAAAAALDRSSEKQGAAPRPSSASTRPMSRASAAAPRPSTIRWRGGEEERHRQDAARRRFGRARPATSRPRPRSRRTSRSGGGGSCAMWE